mmetsp:Transcript_118189/g.232028  ORF Transcript_118189/g.232028 Transcript_118189/m.232028 type:complete len:206 (-) Transcript_118189:231-848(-)
MKLPPLPEVDPSTKGESVTRRLQIREEDGKREEREEVTRCRDGKCTTEVIRGGDEKEAKGRGDVEAPSKRRLSFESISRAFQGGKEDDSQQQQQQRQQQGFWKRGLTRQDQASKAQRGEVGDPSKQQVYSQSVTRTIISRDVDGKREEVETIERCENGKCEKEERRSDGAGAEKNTLEQAAPAVLPPGLGEPVLQAGAGSHAGIA